MFCSLRSVHASKQTIQQNVREKQLNSRKRSNPIPAIPIGSRLITAVLVFALFTVKVLIRQPNKP